MSAVTVRSEYKRAIAERKRQGLDKYAPFHMLIRQTPLQRTGREFVIRMAEEAYETGERESYVVRTRTGKGL